MIRSKAIVAHVSDVAPGPLGFLGVFFCKKVDCLLESAASIIDLTGVPLNKAHGGSKKLLYYDLLHSINFFIFIIKPYDIVCEDIG